MVGIVPNQHSLNWRTLKASLIVLSSTILCVFHLPKTRSFEELTESIYVTATVFAIAFCHVSSIIQMAKMFKYTNDCEKFVIERE